MLKTRRPDLLTCMVDGEVVIFDRAAGYVHQLNRTASHIWSACDRGQDVDEIAARLVAAFDGVPSTVVEDVVKTLADFERLGLLVDGLTDGAPELAERNDP